MFLHRSKQFIQKGGRLSSPTKHTTLSTPSRAFRTSLVDIAKLRVDEARAAQYAPAAGYHKDALEAKCFRDIFSVNDFVGGLAPMPKEDSEHKLSTSVWLTFAASEYALTGGMLSPCKKGLPFNGSSIADEIPSFHERAQVAPHEIFLFYTTIILYRITQDILNKYGDLIIPVGFAKNLEYILNGKGGVVNTGKGGAFQAYINNPELLADLSKCARISFTKTEKESFRLYYKNGLSGKKKKVLQVENDVAARLRPNPGS